MTRRPCAGCDRTVRGLRTPTCRRGGLGLSVCRRLRRRSAAGRYPRGPFEGNRRAAAAGRCCLALRSLPFAAPAPWACRIVAIEAVPYQPAHELAHGQVRVHVRQQALEPAPVRADTPRRSPPSAPTARNRAPAGDPPAPPTRDRRWPASASPRGCSCRTPALPIPPAPPRLVAAPSVAPPPEPPPRWPAACPACCAPWRCAGRRQRCDPSAQRYSATAPPRSGRAIRPPAAREPAACRNTAASP